MPRNSRKKIRAEAVRKNTPHVKSDPPEEKRFVCFNFKHLFRTHPVFSYRNCDTQYFCGLLARLKALSRMTRSELVNNRSDALRCHPIDFTTRSIGPGITGFGLGEDADDEAYQFNISQRAHGRVHGRFIGDIFYIVWLDPDHALYPRNRK